MILKIELECDRELGLRWRFFEKLDEVEHTLIDYDPEIHTGFQLYLMIEEDKLDNKTIPKHSRMTAIICKKRNGYGL